MPEMLKDRYLDKKCLGNQPPIRSLFTYFLLGLHIPCPLFQRGKSTWRRHFGWYRTTPLSPVRMLPLPSNQPSTLPSLILRRLSMQSFTAVQRTYSIARHIIPTLSSKKTHLYSPSRSAAKLMMTAECWFVVRAVYKTFATMATDPKKYRLNHSMIRVKDPKVSGMCQSFIYCSRIVFPHQTPDLQNWQTRS